MTIAEEALRTGREIEASPVGALSTAINDGLSKVIGWPYQLRSGSMVDLDGRTSDAFATVVCMGEELRNRRRAQSLRTALRRSLTLARALTLTAFAPPMPVSLLQRGTGRRQARGSMARLAQT